MTDFDTPPWHSRPRVRVALVLIALVLVIAWIVHHGTRSKGAFVGGPGGPGGPGPGGRGGPGGMDAPIAVAVAKAVKGEMPRIIPALGTITPLATVTVKTQIAGQLVQVAFKEGQMVHARNFLAQIGPRPYQAP